MASLGTLLRLGRPHFLLGGLAFVALGAALAHKAGAALDPVTLALTQFVVTATQWSVHYANEAHDVAADQANPNRTWLAGGTGLIVSGAVPRATSLALARVLLSSAVAGAAALSWDVPATLAVTLPLLLLSWAYSAPPLRLVGRGVGELATGLIVGWLVPATVLVGAGVFPSPMAPDSTLAWLALAPLALQVAALVVVLGIPDAAGDAAAGKRTVAVRWPGRPTRALVQVIWIVCGLATTAAILLGAPPEAMFAGGLAFAAAVGLPMLVARQWWDALAIYALAVVATQWAVTLLWAL